MNQPTRRVIIINDNTNKSCYKYIYQRNNNGSHIFTEAAQQNHRQARAPHSAGIPRFNSCI